MSSTSNKVTQVQSLHSPLERGEGVSLAIGIPVQLKAFSPQCRHSQEEPAKLMLQALYMELLALGLEVTSPHPTTLGIGAMDGGAEEVGLQKKAPGPVLHQTTRALWRDKHPALLRKPSSTHLQGEQPHQAISLCSKPPFPCSLQRRNSMQSKGRAPLSNAG